MNRFIKIAFILGLFSSFSFAVMSDKIVYKTWQDVPMPEQFYKTELEKFTIAFGQELLKEGFTQDELADVIDMFIGAESVADVDEIKGYVLEDYDKKVTLDSKIILYNLPSFEHYKERVAKFVTNASGDEVLALADKIEKSTKSKRYEVFVGALKKLGRIYNEIKELKKENAEGRKRNAEGRKRNAEGRKRNAELDKKIAEGNKKIVALKELLSVLDGLKN